MRASEETRTRPSRVAEQLRREFSELPAARVEHEFELVSGELLEEARFDIFVPLLVDRSVRERLSVQHSAVSGLVVSQGTSEA
jgi:hypothetical protein